MQLTVHIKYAIFSLLLILVNRTGDFIVRTSQGQVFRALADNLTHGIVGGISWLMVRAWKGALLTEKLVLIETALCFLISSAIDVDHFISAKSIHFKDAVSQESRPLLHCTTLMVSLFVVTLAVGLYFHLWWVHILSWILLTAITTHHLRDGLRRGLWLYPFLSTRPVSYWMYTFFLVFYPLLCCCFMDITGQIVLERISSYKYSVLPNDIV